MSDRSKPFDAIVVGGSYAGMSAALQLARARRNVLVIDAGECRNRRARHSHGLIGRDGDTPAQISEQARSQLMAYPTVHWREARVESGTGSQEDTFEVTTTDGARFSARRLVLAYGVRDELPTIDGLAERWGRSVFHCPYCHGYELADQRIGILGEPPHGAAHLAQMLPDWGKVTLFGHDASFAPETALGRRLAERGVHIERSPVLHVEGHATVALADGRRVEMDGLFVSTVTRPASPLAVQLGCEFESGTLGDCLTTDAAKQTTVPGVFACGDVARMTGSVALAIGEGALAGVATHQSLLDLLDD
ncbi:MAG TPA: NAD(P)/FAD-dependent oxidoreductase [Stenotrophomonas sp.]|jgi:thioredoxin reductase